MDRQAERLTPWRPDHYVQECQLVDATLPIEDYRINTQQALAAYETTEIIYRMMQDKNVV